MATLTFFKAAKIIEVDAPQTNVSVQDLVNQIRDYEDNLQCGMDIDKIANATGKDDLGGCPTNFTGITLTLLNDWRVRFENRCGPCVTQVSVSGGNLIAINSFCNNPIAPSTFTQVTVQISLSPSITGTNDEQLKFFLEAQRPHHTGFGNVVFWDPTNGCDGLTGESVAAAVKTWCKAQCIAVDGAHYTIFLLPDAAGGSTVVTCNIVISKSWVFLRGPGPHVKLRPTSGIPLSITGRGVEVSSLDIDGSATTCNPTIRITGDVAYLKDLIVECSPQDGIHVNGASDFVGENILVKNNASIGLHLCCSADPHLINSNIYKNASDGIGVFGALSDELVIKGETAVHENCGYQLNIGACVTNTQIFPSSLIEEDGLGRLNDLGTDTVDGEIEHQTKFLEKIQKNRQVITGNQLIVYDDDGVTPLTTFNLKDAVGGSPTEDNPKERVPV